MPTTGDPSCAASRGAATSTREACRAAAGGARRRWARSTAPACRSRVMRGSSSCAQAGPTHDDQPTVAAPGASGATAAPSTSASPTCTPSAGWMSRTTPKAAAVVTADSRLLVRPGGDARVRCLGRREDTRGHPRGGCARRPVATLNLTEARRAAMARALHEPTDSALRRRRASRRAEVQSSARSKVVARGAASGGPRCPRRTRGGRSPTTRALLDGRAQHSLHHRVGDRRQRGGLAIEIASCDGLDLDRGGDG